MSEGLYTHEGYIQLNGTIMMCARFVLMMPAKKVLKLILLSFDK